MQEDLRQAIQTLFAQVISPEMLLESFEKYADSLEQAISTFDGVILAILCSVRPDSYAVVQGISNQRAASLLPRLIEEINMRVRLIKTHRRDNNQIREEIRWLIELIANKTLNNYKHAYNAIICRQQEFC
ncbi:MAG: hypothetical protein HC905_23095 [Bacteroidales bacterium]|nr:hypothetical protein [Bacteroidales bacterium]